MWWFGRSKPHEAEIDSQKRPSDETATTDHASDNRLLDMQHAVGNRAVQRMVDESTQQSLESLRSTIPLALPDMTPREHTSLTGEPLDKETRELMEVRFGTNFEDVLVHTDIETETSAAELNAKAYTVEREIYFARGMYAPKSKEGQRLLAHELTHIVQQRRGINQPEELSDPADASEREAEEIAGALERGERAPAVVSAAEGIQRDVGWAQRGPLPDPYGTLLLLNGFAKKFPDAAKLIHTNPAAMKLVDEAEAAGVQFGGYAEDGPGKAAGRAYTSGNTVYVPKTQTDPVMAMRDFLFELNNALRAPKFAELFKEAAKGTKGSVTAKDYSYKVVEQEAEGMLRLGEIWFETKKTMPKDPKTDAYDPWFFLSDYQAVKTGKKTKDDLVKDVLKRVYETGTLKGKTVEQHYMEQYSGLSGGK